MSRYVALMCLCVVLVVAEPEADPEGGYGQRYSQRQREGRRESHETSQRFTPSQKVEEVQQQEIAPEVTTSPRHQRQRANIQEHGAPLGDSNVDVSSYRTVVLHDNQENQRYQNPRKKPTKPRQKANRQVHRETSATYKSLKNSKLPDPPPHSTNILHVTTPVPDQFVHAVHPSIMQNLLKQQPQTFDVPQEKEADNYEQPINWQSQDESQNSNHQGLKSFHTNFGSQGDSVGQQENYDVNKRPIYVPNRVSVQSPSSDTSFNVGYSIGFGSGLTQPPRMGIVQPAINFRHGKQLSIPVSYQNVPVNVHIDGKNSVWKSMGPGVEMSHNVEGTNEGSDRHVYPSGSVINQPIFFREGFDQSLSSISTSGRNNFDHNHALQQSNSFDFSNAIDPMSNQPFSTEQRTNQFISHVQPSFAESFSKQPIHSFTESFDKNPHSSYSETYSKQTKDSFIRGQHNHQTPKVESAQYTHAVLGPNNNPVSSEAKYERPKLDKPGFSTGLHSSARIPNSISLMAKQKATDFSKSIPGGAKSTYSYKTFGNTSPNSVSDDVFGNNFGLQSTPALQSMYPGKIAPGMVQAILVPVNSQNPPLTYHVGMPVLGNGYSPYFGHPVGMVRIPDPTGFNSPQKEEFEDTYFNIDPHLENKPQQIYSKTPVKLVQTPYVSRHQHEEAQDPQHHLPRPNSLNYLRAGDLVDHSPQSNRPYALGSPEQGSFIKSQSPSLHTNVESSFDEPYFKGTSDQPSFKEPSPSYLSMKETSPVHHPISHHPRPYRTKKLVIVKRS